MPGTAAVGDEDGCQDERNRNRPGWETCSIAGDRSFLRRHAFFNVVLDGLHHNDGVVDHQTDRQH